MTVHYDLVEEDWLSLNLHYLAQSGQLRKTRRRFAMLAVLCLLEAFLCWFLQWNFGAFFFSAAGLAFVLNVIRLPNVLRKQLQRQVKQGDLRALFGHHELTLTPQGIQTKSPIAESLYYWSAVEQLVETETHLFVQFSSAVRLMIPKRAFATQTHGTLFLKQAEEYRQAATGTPIPTTHRGAWWTQGSQVVEAQSQRH